MFPNQLSDRSAFDIAAAMLEGFDKHYRLFRATSGQARLVDALRRAGGPPGYLIVVKIDDLAAPVSPEDVAELLKNGR